MIKIGEYGINADALNYTVGKIKILVDKDTKEEKEILTSCSYVSSLKQAIQVILKSKQLEYVSKNNCTLDEVLIEFDKLHNKMVEILERGVKDEIK